MDSLIFLATPQGRKQLSGTGHSVIQQAGAHLPPGKIGSLSQAGSQASQAVTSQPGAHLPLGKEAT